MKAGSRDGKKPPVLRSKLIKLDAVGFIERMTVLEELSGVVPRRPPLEAELIVGGLRLIIILMEVLRRTRGKTIFEPKFSSLDRKLHLPDTGLVPFFENCLNLQLEIAEKYLPYHEFHPAIRLFASCQKAFPQYGNVIFAPKNRGADLFQYSAEMNDAIEKIRSVLSSVDFVRACKDFIRSAHKNHQTLTDYVNTLFTKRATLWVIRLDLACPFSPNTVPVEYEKTNAQPYRENFLAFLRSKSPVGRPFGYSWKLECGFNGAWRYHFLLFFTPLKGFTAIEIGDLLGTHWANVITEGKGLYRNCNSLPERDPRRLGTGTINRSKIRRRGDLNKAIRYMTQLDYYAKLRPGKRGNTFYGGDKATAAKKKPITRKPRATFRGKLSEIEQHQAMPRFYQEETNE